ncbi:MAG TPA: hypothetical protein VEL51_06010 [Vicinamibacterales bacterium]|nr:hypothetical protein [Vicinamibacterales bacterium]
MYRLFVGQLITGVMSVVGRQIWLNGVPATIVGIARRSFTGDVMRLLLWDSLRPVAIGLAAGAGVALLASQLLAGILYGVGARDPLAFASAIGVLLVSAAAAVFIPARRAARVDPAFVLRQS